MKKFLLSRKQGQSPTPNEARVFKNKTLRLVWGQAIVEIIVISMVIVFVSIAIAEIVNSSLKGIDTAESRSGAIYLGQEESESLRAVAKEDWHNISNLATSSSNTYHTATSSGKWVTATSSENINLNNATYTRYFYLSDVYRSTSTDDIATSGGYYDPETSKVAVNITWNDNFGNTNQFSQVEYLSRYPNQSYSQTDWTGGAAGEVVTTAATTTYATSSAIDTTGAGSIQLTTQ
jgi:hypothetical protein